MCFINLHSFLALSWCCTRKELVVEVRRLHKGSAYGFAARVLLQNLLQLRSNLDVLMTVTVTDS